MYAPNPEIQSLNSSYGIYNSNNCMYKSVYSRADDFISNHIYNHIHYSGVMMGAMASQITSLTIVYSTVYSCADAVASQITSITITYSTVHSGTNHRKQQSSTSLAFVRGFHRWPVNFPHKWPVTRKMFPFDDVILHLCGRMYMDFSFLCDKRNNKVVLIIIIKKKVGTCSQWQGPPFTSMV